MEQTKEFTYKLDVDSHKEIIETTGVQTLVTDNKGKRDRLVTLVNRFDDNINAMDFIRLKVKGLGRSDNKYILEARLKELSDSNDRIISAVNKLIV